MDFVDDEGDIDEDNDLINDVIMIDITQKYPPHQQPILNIIIRVPPYNNPVWVQCTSHPHKNLPLNASMNPNPNKMNI